MTLPQITAQCPFISHAFHSSMVASPHITVSVVQPYHRHPRRRSDIYHHPDTTNGQFYIRTAQTTSEFWANGRPTLAIETKATTRYRQSVPWSLAESSRQVRHSQMLQFCRHHQRY